MSNENRRQTKIVVAFLIIALAAVSPLVFRHKGVDAPQAGQLLLGSAPSGHDSGEVTTSQHDGVNAEQHIIDYTCVFACPHSAAETADAHPDTP